MLTVTEQNFIENMLPIYQWLNEHHIDISKSNNQLSQENIDEIMNTFCNNDPWEPYIPLDNESIAYYTNALLNLEYLDLSNASLKNESFDLPYLTNFFKQIKEINLSNNSFTHIPDVVFNMKSLEVLDCRNLNLTSIPEKISELTSLKKLYLSGNALTSLPESIAQLTQLEKLNIGNMKLTELPEAITKLNKLELLIASNNQLFKLPDNLHHLTKLNYLDLAHNKLTEFPIFKANHQLTHLYLDNNNLSEIAHWVFKSHTLKLLSQKGNHETKIPSEIMIGLELYNTKVLHITLTLNGIDTTLCIESKVSIINQKDW